jgi:catechol 2,3-dioxygenase-like lactoylglutathione lyase family enzyme
VSAGLQHVSLETRPGDVDAEVRFWALLGFSRVEPPGALGERAAWVQADDGTQIHLLFTDSPTVLPQGHVAVVCPAYAETLDALSRGGFEIDERARHWGAPRLYVHSPAGHLVEVMESPPTA